MILHMSFPDLNLCVLGVWLLCFSCFVGFGEPLQTVCCGGWYILLVPRPHWKCCTSEAAVWLKQSSKWSDHHYWGLQNPEGQRSFSSWSSCEGYSWKVCIHSLWQFFKSYFSGCCMYISFQQTHMCIYICISFILWHCNIML